MPAPATNTPAPRRPGPQQGFVLVGALLIMLLLVLIGISATTSTNLELQIAGADRARNEVFYAADSGVNPVPRLITIARSTDQDPAVAGINILGAPGTFYDEVMGFTPEADRISPNLTFPFPPHQVAVGINHRGAQPMVGGGAEFAAGAAGVGAGAVGGVMIMYEIDAEATRTIRTADDTRAAVRVRYRHVPGTAGGLQ